MTREILDSPPPGDDVPAELSALFEEHHARIYHAAYRVTGNATDAEDVLQTIFLRLLRREEPVELGPTAGSYLYRAAVNAALDLLRSRRRARAVDLDAVTPEAEIDHSPAFADPGRRFEDRELRERIRRALAGVSERSAEIFTLRYFEGYGNTEIADMIGTSRSSVAVTLHRTRNQLKKELASFLGDES